MYKYEVIVYCRDRRASKSKFTFISILASIIRSSGASQKKNSLRPENILFTVTKNSSFLSEKKEWRAPSRCSIKGASHNLVLAQSEHTTLKNALRFNLLLFMMR